jgi:hypothetical protein
MIVKPALAAMLASGLVAPEKPPIILPRPAILRAQSIEFSRHMLLGMPLTMGMLAETRSQPIQLVGARFSIKAGASSGNTTIIISSGLTGGIGSSAQSGDLVIAAFASSGVSSLAKLISDGSTPYTIVGSELYQSDTYGTNLRLAYKRMGATPDASVTFGPTGNANDAGVMIVFVFRNVSASSPIITSSTAQAANSGLPNPPAITPNVSGAVIVAVGAAGNGAGNGRTFACSNMPNMVSASQSDTGSCCAGMASVAYTSGSFDPAAFTASYGDSSQYSWAAITCAIRPV